MLIQRSRSLLVSTACAIAFSMACSRADTRHAAPGAVHETSAESNAPLAPPAPVVSAAPAPASGEDTSSSVPSEVAASEPATDEIEGAVRGSPSPMPVLNQLLTTQALLVSLLLTPVAKAPPELPEGENEPPLRLYARRAEY